MAFANKGNGLNSSANKVRRLRRQPGIALDPVTTLSSSVTELVTATLDTDSSDEDTIGGSNSTRNTSDERSDTRLYDRSSTTDLGLSSSGVLTTTRSRYSPIRNRKTSRTHTPMRRNDACAHEESSTQHCYGDNMTVVCGESFCDCQHTGRDVECHCGEDDTAFDWIWETEYRASASEVSADKRDVRFHVSCSSGTAAVRGSKPMTDSQYFWEVKMTTPVYGTDMMVGVGTENVDLDAFRHAFCSQLGKDADSWGLSYYGRVQHRGLFKQVGESRFGQGSIIGVHLDMWHGTLSFYKNRRLLGVAYRGLSGKQLYPMVSSTAARSGMRIIKSCSFRTSLQFLCCQVLRRIIPGHLDVIETLNLPPGLRAFLENNLTWLLRPCELSRLSRLRTANRDCEESPSAKQRRWQPSSSNLEEEEDEDE